MMLLVASTNVKAQTNAQRDWTNVIDAIAMIESGGNPKAHNKNGDCAGLLQITPVLVMEINNQLKARKINKKYSKADRYNPQKSKEMFVWFQKFFNKSGDVEKAVRMWNGGIGYKIKSTNGYYKKFLKYYHPKTVIRRGKK